MENIVSAAIFGDGAKRYFIITQADKGPIIVDESMYHFYDSVDIMGFKLVNTGLQMILDKKVPEIISNVFIDYLSFRKNNLKIEE